MELIERITQKANERYVNHKCNDCLYLNCTSSCEKCLEYCHYPERAIKDGFEKRDYNCLNMIDFYVCKYSYKNATEIIRAFLCMKKIIENNTINILSLGCGPCSELMAIDTIKKRNLITFDKIFYKGIEVNIEIWKNIYSDINSNFAENYIKNEDVINISNFEIYFMNDAVNIICINYLLSTIQRCKPDSINSFLNSLACSINNSKKKIIVLFNDINLSINYEGGIREYFDTFASKLIGYSSKEIHFKGSKHNHYEYGNEYPNSTILYNDLVNEEKYKPYKVCGSAQKIIYKRIKKYKS